MKYSTALFTTYIFIEYSKLKYKSHYKWKKGTQKRARSVLLVAYLLAFLEENHVPTRKFTGRKRFIQALVYNETLKTFS